MYQSTNPETNKILHAMGEMNFSGNITPMEWCKNIRHNGKADSIAILLLSDIVYWYRPTILRDQSAGLPIGYQKKFKADLLQKSYREYSDLFGFSAQQIRDAFIRLEKLGVIQRILRTVNTPIGKMSNVLFIKLNTQILHSITFPVNAIVSEATPSPYSDQELLVSKPIAPGFETKTNTKTTTETTTEEEEHSAPSLPQEVLLDSDKKKQKKGTRLPEDWVLPQEWRLWSSAHGMANDLIEVNAMKFKNYWLSTNKNPVKVDWYRTWQNWCIDELQRKGIMVKDQSASTRPISAPLPTIEVKQSANPKIQQWNDLQSVLMADVGMADYNSWLEDLQPVQISEKAIFKASNRFKAQWVERVYRENILAILQKIDPQLTESSMEIIF